MASSSTKYLRKRTRIEFSRNADYSSPLTDEEYTEEYEATRYKKQEYLAATGGTTVDLSEFTTIEDLFIFNRDGSNYVETTHRTAAGGATDQNTRVDAGKSVCLGDVTVATDLVLTANGAACEVVIEVYGTA